eukprot:1590947-Prorocentrum_lima.AAC.1
MLLPVRFNWPGGCIVVALVGKQAALARLQPNIQFPERSRPVGGPGHLVQPELRANQISVEAGPRATRR